jgi:hypothetical protein
MSDASIALIARDLVEALKDAAYTRSEADRKHVTELHTALCAERRAELAEAENGEREGAHD